MTIPRYGGGGGVCGFGDALLMKSTCVQETKFDVVIMGAGFAGLCAARHLLLKQPSLRVALIDPHDEVRKIVVAR